MAEQARALGANAVFVDDAERAVAAVLERIGGKDVILVKGSRGVALEHVVGALEAWGEGQSA
ncbi:MAG: putative bifunctional UDP-N-acetylmuramoylalanyl-D-glutamate--2,6-diaminopimelate ligase/UDP-N-acetylmuramoyl-tripeptide:D-alanyl-D-alanine ligase [Deltaproteobacteria bacterium ADurb.Bin207]|jgi:UDP-N-acetylmuramyl pentapeptide synthase|nr:MAG: putative bifunctional UDP-N-acetylmuramoylalanyl-D-glutamate--2,6-diaminopimelate ligase/UDP-N-acetylmuramoyl-tripeptide:D-alanyl-D-alanine ligase [Deltaproteobacteria bacterium ADurb.Bin207]